MKHTRLLLFLTPFLLFFACTKDFEAINTNENAPSEVQPELLLRQVLYGYGDAMSYEGFVAGSLLSQHFSMIDFNLFDRHALASPQEGGDPWPILYTALRDNETVLELARANPARRVYEGPALVMKAYLTMTLTDLFGDVPYTDAFRGRSAGITKPGYDEQEQIYLGPGGILENLTRAVEVMDAYNGAQQLRGDIVYNGNLENWSRFANSLRIKALMRISARQAPGAQLQELYDGGRYITTAGENAVFAFAAGPPNDYPMARARIGIFNVFLQSATAAEIYQAFGDSREATVYRPSAANGDFAGIINGIDAASAIVPDDFARPGTVFRENSGGFEFNFLTSWEVNFLLAEAAARGFISVDSEKDLYDNGVRQAFAYWNTPLNNDYLESAPVRYSEGDSEAQKVERIITQKWMASIGNGYEAWTEWRRTGYPELKPVAASLNDGVYPVRMPYPSEEQALNFENYRQAASATDGNSVNAPVWWDVE